MWQRVALSRRRYYHFVILLALGSGGCAGRPGPIVPETLPAVSRAEADAWVEGYAPDHPLLYTLRWRHETQKGGASGRATVRFVPPDSIRFDYRGPFGRSGAAVLVGEKVVWSEPQEDAEGFVGVAPLFWAAIGIPQYAAASAELTGRRDERVQLWRYSNGTDTLTYRTVVGSPATLEAELRHNGARVGLAEVTFADSTGLPEKALMRFPQDATVITFTVRAIEPLASVDPDIWRQP
jgi:hypothetical protein